MDSLQALIHRLEVGGGLRYFRIGLVVLAFLVLCVGYNWRAFKNLASLEAMDSAQLARNLSEGKGYTTLFVRPFSMYLLKRRCQDHQTVGDLANLANTPDSADATQLKGRHPDLANPPVYPVLLAGWMKLMPFRYQLPTKPEPFWTAADGRFLRYEPDFLIGLLNQLLFFGMVVAMFFLARRLFDPGVAWLTGLVLLGTDLLWRFSLSGLSTILLMLILTGLAWCLVLLEEELREARWGRAGAFVLAGLAGALVATGALTRYSFGWLIVPVLLFVLLYSGRQRAGLGLTTFFAFALLFTPWLVRNYMLSGTPFGTATYAIMEGTYWFPEHKLQRSLDPDLHQSMLLAFWQKLTANTRQIVQTDLPKLGGTWLSAFFLVGLLVAYPDIRLRRLRYFVLSGGVVLVLVQALGRTQLAEDSPEINSENLLVLLTPLVVMYGVSLFFLFLDQIHIPLRELRYLLIGTFSAVVCLPLLLTFLPPKTSPIAYPPYNPPALQAVSGWMKPNELIMSDVPWAVAWYGQRQSLWLTLNCQSDFLAVNDYQKAVSAVYLSPMTTGSKFFSLAQGVQTGEPTWGNLVLQTLVRKEVPPGFPLHKFAPVLLPNEMVFTDWERWRRTEP